jgi:hypothetical protein
MYALLLIDKKGFEKRIKYRYLPLTYEMPLAYEPPLFDNDSIDIESLWVSRITFYYTGKTTLEGVHIYREK